MPDFSDVQLVVTDMDGSLLNSQHEVSEEFFTLYQQLRDKGIHFAAASGRQYASILDKLQTVADDLIVVAENGAYVVMEGKEILATELSHEQVMEVLTTVKDLPQVNAVVCTRNNAYIRADRPEFLKYMSEFYTAHQTLDDLRTYSGPALKVALYHPESSEQYIYPHVADLAPACKVKVSGLHWVDVSHPDAHKGHAITLLQQRLGVTPAQTMVFGDYHNDLEMLACADFSYAMGNAHPDIVAAARYRTGSNDEGGVEMVLREMVLREVVRGHSDIE